jgi:hypothetical protein
LRLSAWDTFQGLGAVASIVGLGLFLWDATERHQLLIAILVVAGTTAVIVASIVARNAPLQPISREAMIEMGQRLILSTSRELIMFGGDMSWAPDYESQVQQIVSEGKRVTIIYPRSQAPAVQDNVARLARTGAELIAASRDSGIRGMLLDPTDPNEAVLWVAKRTAAGSVPQSSRFKKPYAAKAYGMRKDWLLVQTSYKVYEVLARRDS